MGLTEMPGCRRSTMNCDSPCCRSLAGSRGSNQGEHVGDLCANVVQSLRPVQQPSRLGSRGPGPHAGKVRSCVGLAHADAEKYLAATDSRQVEFAAAPPCHTEKRPALTVAEPMRGDRRAGDQQFFDQDEAPEGIASAASIPWGQGRPSHPRSARQRLKRASKADQLRARVCGGRSGRASTRKDFTWVRNSSAPVGMDAPVKAWTSEFMSSTVHVAGTAICPRRQYQWSAVETT